MNGILVLDKPAGISSTRAVTQIKRLMPRGTKIGHAGTLDPFATGVLLLLLGKSTKLCEPLMDEPKQYEATLKFGANTDTDDLDSPEQPRPVQSIPSIDQIEISLQSFVGEIQQRPPVYSALKIGGKRACDLVRAGREVRLEPRTVKVYGITTLHFAWPLLSLRIDCGRGTYIRSIARELGDVLAVGGYLTQLRRTRIGPFGVGECVTIEDVTREGVEGHLKAYHPV